MRRWKKRALAAEAAYKWTVETECTFRFVSNDRVIYEQTVRALQLAMTVEDTEYKAWAGTLTVQWDGDEPPELRP